MVTRHAVDHHAVLQGGAWSDNDAVWWSCSLRPSSLDGARDGDGALAVGVMGHMLMADRWCGGDPPCI